MAYNPQSLEDRRSLGQSLISTLSEKGFILWNPKILKSKWSGRGVVTSV